MTMIDDTPNSRRKVMKDLATGLTPASAAPAAFGQKSGREPASAEFLPNPATEYPVPAQQQEWPGLVSKMTPRPDHGETSYKGIRVNRPDHDS